MKNNDEVKGWHFVSEKLRNGDPIPLDGEWLKFTGEAVLCKSGLHASKRALDALQYAPGSTICRVTCRNIVEENYNKFVCRERRIDWRIDADDLLREFARKCALSVIHLWDAPDIVRRYLETGDESIRAAAKDVAKNATKDAADAAWAAACGVAWDAARIAAKVIARGEAWVAARDAAFADFNTQLEAMLTAEHERTVGK